MAHSPSATNLNSRFQSIINQALQEYKNTTGKDLPSHPLFRDLTACDSAGAILGVLQRQLPGYDAPGGSQESSKWPWLGTTVDVLSQVLQTIGSGVGIVYPPAGVVFSAICVLLSVAKAFGASHGSTLGSLSELFEHIVKFLRRLETYMKVPPIPEIQEVIVKVMAEVLSVLAVATKVIEQRPIQTVFSKLVGYTVIDDALDRLDKVTREEALTVAAHALDAAHRVNDKVAAIADAVEGIDSKMSSRVKGVESRVHCIEGKMKSFRDVLDNPSSLESLDRNKLRWALREWLSPPDPSVNYRNALESYHKGTTTWFTQGDTFADWKTSGSLMWIYGNPGSGKSILTSAVIQSIDSPFDTGSAFLAFFFFDFKDAEKQDVYGLLSSFLIQLSDQSDSYCDKLLALYSSHRRGSESPKPGYDALMECLKDMLVSAGQVPVYLVIDALDECPDNYGIPSPRGKVLELVKRLVELHLPNLRLFATSRPESDIRAVLDPLTCTSLSLHDQEGQKTDIVDYINHVIDSEATMKRWRDEDKTLVIQTLSDRAGGMFRWVYCQLERLRRCIVSSVRGILQELPESLDETYARILREISKENREYAYRLLQCLTVATRPLRVEELAEVIAIDFTIQGTPTLNGDLRWEDQEEAVLLACSSLVAVIDDEDSRIVQFSHFSVKEFLTSDRLAGLEDASYYHIKPEPAHIVMAQACLAVLLRLADEGMKSFPLAKYAATHLGNHAEFGDVISHIRDGLDTLFDSEKPHSTAWLDAVHPLQRGYVSGPMHPLYYVAKCGFLGMARHLLSRCPQDANVCHWYGTPLDAAANAGHIEVSRLLLEYGADVDIVASGREGRTPLHSASNNGHLDIVRLLLDEDDRRGKTTSLRRMAKRRWFRSPVRIAGVHARDHICRLTPLHLACMNGHHAVAQLLLDRNADVDVQDMNSMTPLHRVIEYVRYTDTQAESFKAVFEVLVKSNANLNAKNNIGNTPLHLACSVGHRDVVRLLLGRHVDTELQNNSHSTPQLLALKHRKRWRIGTRKAVAKVFIESGANVNIRNCQGRTPLHLAAEEGHHDSARLLLDLGVDVDMDALDESHSTPLHLALGYRARPNIEMMFKVLLESGANVNIPDDKGQTPLHLAAHLANRVAISSLLDRGAKLDAQDNNHSTPLHLASSENDVVAVKMLIECGANVHARNKQGETPLHVASREGGTPSHFREGNLDVMRLLLDQGAVPDARDNSYSTPLYEASSRGEVDLVNLLLKYGASVHVRNNEDMTVLHSASKSGDFETMRVLLDQGAEVDAQDRHHHTPLHLASSQWKAEAVGLLIECGANVHARSDEGMTALHFASRDGNLETMQLLLNKSVELDALNNSHITPLHLASSENEVEAVELLIKCGANIHAQTHEGKTALHFASMITDSPFFRWGGRTVNGAVTLLINCSANIHARSNKGETALHLASKQGSLKIVRYLLAKGANVDAQDNNLLTPLHLASSTSDVKRVQLLIDYGANLHMRNKEGETPFQVASKTDHVEVKLLLSKHTHPPIPKGLVRRIFSISKKPR